jgi:hypothetical protein
LKDIIFLEENKMILPEEFKLDVVGASGENYKGVFRIKAQLTYRDALRMDQLRRELIGSNAESVSLEAADIAHVLSKIQVHLVATEDKPLPSWWKDSKGGLDLVDPEPLKALYEKVVEIESAYVKQIKERAEVK